MADGEDFTRKSSRLSSTRVPAAEGDGNYCNFSPGGGKQLVLDTSGAFETSSSSSGAQDGGNLTAATQEIKVAPPTTAPKRSTRRSRKRIQEEENYREFLESNANQPRLLTDLDRDSWVGAAVTYLPTLQRGRVTEYRSGWAVIRTLEGSLNCRPYQLEIIEAESVDMEQFEEEELWALCGEGEGEGGTQQVSNQSMSNEGQSVFPADMEVDDGAGSGDMYFDESGMLYDAFTNDREYDEYLLRQFDIPAGTSAENDLPLPGEMDQTLISDTTAQQLRSTGPGVAGAPKMSRAEIQSIRLQQQKPSRTKLIEVIPPQLTEVEKKRKLDALARSRQQVQQLLRPNAPAATNTHSAGAAPSAVPARSITINRAATSSTILNVSEQHKSEASIPAVKSAERFIPQVMKLGIAPPLAKPSFLRGFGNNWRRPTTEPARRTSFPPTIPTGSTSNPRAERSPAGRVAEVPPPASAQPAITSNNSASSSASGGNSTSMHPAKSQQLTASEEAQREAELQALRDPRLRARLERALPPPPSAAPMRPAGPEIPKMPCLGTARDTDTRSERNSSAAIRTMRANIQYLQAGYAVDGEKALQAAQEKAANNGTFTSNVAGASASSSVLVRRAVTFNVRENSISAAVIDSDVLNITDAADVAAFSPNESDSDESSVEAETIRFNIRAVDEIDRATRPAVQRLPRTAVLVNGGAASAVETSNPASTIQVVAQQDQPRKSRFEAVPAVAHLGFVTPAVLISAAAEQTSQMPMSMPMPMEVQQQQDEVFDDYGYGEYDYPDMPLSKAERRRQKRHAAARAKHQQESAGTFAFINSQDKTNISTTVAVTPTANDAAQNPPAGIQTQRLSERRAAQQSEPPQQRKPTPREDLEPGEVEDDDDLKSLPDEPPQQVVPVDKAVAIGSKKKPAQQQFQQSALSTGVVATASNKPTISSREVKIVKPVEFTPFRAPVREESVNNILAAADRDPASHWRGAAVISGGSLNIPFIADVLESTAASAAAAAAIERASVAASSSKPRRKMHINLDKTYPQFNHRENELLAIAHMDEVMPLSMSNLTALLTESDFFPPIGYTRTEYFPPKSTPLNGYDMGESGYDFETRQEKPLYPLEVHHQSHYQSAEGLQLHHQQYPPPMELPAPAFSTPLFPYQQEQEPHQQAEDPHMHMHMQHHREHRQHRATGNVPLAGGDVPRPSLQEEHQQRSRRSRFETPGGIHPSSHIPDTFAGRQFQESRSDSHIQAQAAQHQQEGAPRTSVRTSRFAAPAQQASVHDRNGAHLNQVPTFPPGHKRDFSAAFHYQQLQDRSLEHHELHSAECLQEERYSDPFYDGRNVHARANANSSDRMVSYAAEPHHSSASYPQQQQHQRDHHASSYTSAHDPGLLLSQDFYTEDRAVSQEVQQNQSGINHNGNKRSRWG